MKDKSGFFKKIIVLDTVGSTNTYLKDNESEDGVLVYTFNQTGGRGRGDRRWIDIKDKNLALSVLLRPETRATPVWYVASVSLSVIELLRKNRIKGSWIKWPNDIYVEDKKISGILAESSWKNGVVEKMIIGVGLNVNSVAEDLVSIGRKATSIRIETGSETSLNDVSAEFIIILEKYFSMLYSTDGIRKISRLWKKNSKFIGMYAEWTLNDKKTTGIIKKIFDDGTIGLKSGNDLHRIVSGDVEIKY
jgi:BirA family biotin operon repressor/biotin-[acetyl-CoA-carboxylase] ligase